MIIEASVAFSSDSIEAISTSLAFTSSGDIVSISIDSLAVLILVCISSALVYISSIGLGVTIVSSAWAACCLASSSASLISASFCVFFNIISAFFCLIASAVLDIPLPEAAARPPAPPPAPNEVTAVSIASWLVNRSAIVCPWYLSVPYLVIRNSPNPDTTSSLPSANTPSAVPVAVLPIILASSPTMDGFLSNTLVSRFIVFPAVSLAIRPLPVNANFNAPYSSIDRTLLAAYTLATSSLVAFLPSFISSLVSNISLALNAPITAEPAITPAIGLPVAPVVAIDVAAKAAISGKDCASHCGAPLAILYIYLIGSLFSNALCSPMEASVAPIGLYPAIWLALFFSDLPRASIALSESSWPTASPISFNALPAKFIPPAWKASINSNVLSACLSFFTSPSIFFTDSTLLALYCSLVPVSIPRISLVYSSDLPLPKMFSAPCSSTEP